MAGSAGGRAGQGGTGDGGAAEMCPDSEERHARADRALWDMLIPFWVGSENYLRAAVPGDSLAAYWVYAQALDAVLDAAERTGGTRYVATAEMLIAGQEARGFSSDFYDDENWLALALIRAYDLARTDAYLAQAEALFLHIADAWDETCCGDAPGGIWWDAAHSQKATASNGGPVITAARLAERTGDGSYLELAEKYYTYWFATMVDAQTYEVTDHVTPGGEEVRWSFTYNEGVMIGAALELHRATGEARYLTDARGFADRMLAEQTADSSAGPVLSDGMADACRGDCQQFKGIGYRYLHALELFAPDPEVRALLTATAESIWTTARDPVTGHFGTDWAAPPAAGGASISQTSAAVTALNLHAARCVPPAAPSGVFEAEEGFLRGLGVEDSAAGFSGFAYVAGWGSAGQRVELRITAPSAGDYRLDFRYAAESDATRRVSLDGRVLADDLVFAATGSWSSYSVVSFEQTLPSTEGTLSIEFSDANSGYVNLDSVSLTPR
jgi:predicted alpha-1,6-mannanase (GH76 family)